MIIIPILQSRCATPLLRRCRSPLGYPYRHSAASFLPLSCGVGSASSSVRLSNIEIDTCQDDRHDDNVKTGLGRILPVGCMQSFFHATMSASSETWTHGSRHGQGLEQGP